MVVTLIALSAIVVLVNCQQDLWQDSKCRKQIRDFNECKSKIFIWKEQEERINSTKVLYDQCVEKQGCIKQEDLTHDLEYRKRKCSTDVSNVVKQKVVACVRLRVSPDFELPEANDWAYGRFSYEAIPLAISLLESQCKRGGDFEGVKHCYQEVSNRTMMSDAERAAYFVRGCQRRDACFKMLDDECLAKYDAYRQSFCDCAFDVHEIYGGKRLMNLIPSCAGLIGDKKGKYLKEYETRDSCSLEDLNERDYLNKICELGYDRYTKMMKEKMAASTTTTATSTTTVATIKKA